MSVINKRKFKSSTYLFLAVAGLVLILLAPVGGADTPTQASIARIDRDLLLGFLADPTTMTLIDARSPEEYDALHIPGAINIPFDSVESSAALLPEDAAKPVVVYCRTGRRAGNLKEQLEARGYTDVRILPIEQMHWSDGFMAFNCATESAANQPIQSGLKDE